MQMHGLALLGALMFLNACGSVRVFELPKVQKNLMETMQKCENITQKAQSDYADKKLLLDNLAKGGSSLFRENENDLRRRLTAMDGFLQDMVVEKKKMSEANGDIVSLSYSRTTVRSDEREFPTIEEAVQRFEAAATELNAAVVDYSRESNSLADLIAQKKLFFNFDVAEFQKRVQKSILVSQENQKVMQRELSRSESVLNSWSKPDGRHSLEEIFNEMQSTANDYSTRANRFAELSQEMHGVTLGNARVSTLDEQWPAVQKVVSDFDRTVRDLAALNEKFQRKAESFRNPARRVR